LSQLMRQAQVSWPMDTGDLAASLEFASPSADLGQQTSCPYCGRQGGPHCHSGNHWTVETGAAGRGAFQDGSAAGLNDIELFRPISKFALQVEDPRTIDLHIRRAVRSMLGTQYGPVYSKLPRDVQDKSVAATYQLWCRLFTIHRFWIASMPKKQ